MELRGLIENIRKRAVMKDPKNEPRRQPRHLLIVGSKNTGKRTLATMLARCCYCSRYTEEGACGKCSNCRSQPYALADTRPCPRYLFAHLLGEELTIEGFELFWRQTWKAGALATPKNKRQKSSAKETKSKRGVPGPEAESKLNGQLDEGEQIVQNAIELTRSKVILIEGFDRVGPAVQEHLLRTRFHPFGSDHWIFTAEEEGEIRDEVKLQLFTVCLHLAPPPLDEFIQFLGERCRDEGIAYIPSELTRLATLCEQSGQMFHTAMSILDEASKQERALRACPKSLVR